MLPGKKVLVVRLDSAGDVLLAGPAIRAVAAGARRVALLSGPRGRAAAELLPGVDEVLTWPCPWVDPEPGPVRRDDVLAAADAVSRTDAGQAVILTSFHQDPLPTALVLRLAGVPHITAACEDYPGTLAGRPGNTGGARMRVALVSEHASPLAVLGGTDAGGQNAHVAALATGLAKRGAQVVVHTRRDDPDMPRRIRMARGVVVDHVPAGPAELRA